MMLGSGWLFSDVDYAVLPWLIIIGLLVSAMISFGLPMHALRLIWPPRITPAFVTG